MTKRALSKLRIVHQSGAALVELSIAIFLLIIIIGGTIDYGIALSRAHTMLEISYNAAKLAYGYTEGKAANCSTLFGTGSYNVKTEILDRLLANGETSTSVSDYTAEVCIIEATDPSAVIPLGGYDIISVPPPPAAAQGLSLLKVTLTKHSGNCAFCLSSFYPLPGQSRQTAVYPIECGVSACQTLTFP